MKKVFESMHLNEWINCIKQWVKKKRGNDDDIFGHPFAIF